MAVKGCSIAWNNAAYLISTPVPNKLTTSLLKKVSMTRVKADTTGISIFALSILLAVVSTSTDPLIII